MRPRRCLALAAGLVGLAVLGPAGATHEGQVVYRLVAAGEADQPGNLLLHHLPGLDAPEPVGFRVHYWRYASGAEAYIIELEGRVTRATCLEDDHPTPIPDGAALFPPVLQEARWELRRVPAAMGPFAGPATLLYDLGTGLGLAAAEGAVHYEGTCFGLALHQGPSGQGIRIDFAGLHGYLRQALARCPMPGDCGAQALQRVPGAGMSFTGRLESFTLYQETA